MTRFVQLESEYGPMLLAIPWIIGIVPTNDGKTNVLLGSGQLHLHHGPAPELIEHIRLAMKPK